MGRKRQGDYCSRCLSSSVSALAISVGHFSRGILCVKSLPEVAGGGRSALVWWLHWQLISPSIKQKIFDLTVMIKDLFLFLTVHAHFATDVLWFSPCRRGEGWGMCSTKALLTLDGVTPEVVHHTLVQLACLFCHLFSYPVQTIQTLFIARKHWE